MDNQNIINIQNEEILGRNYDTEEIIIGRTRTTTYGVEEEQVSVEQILTVLQIYEIDEIECIQKVFIEGKPVYEITYENETAKTKSEEKLKGKIPINNIILQQINNRKLKNTIKIPLTAVTLFESPAELNDEKIMLKMNEYGETKRDVYHHKIKHTNIKNGCRTVYFKKINKSIPTVLWINGNRIKIRYEGQDRTPICSFCKNRGHYRDICETLKELNKKKEELQKEMEEERREEEERDSNLQKSWARAVEENERNETKKQYSDIVSDKGKGKDSSPRKQFQIEMRKNRATLDMKKKDDHSQRILDIEAYNTQNVRKHIDKTEEQLKEEQEKKKKRKEEKKKRQQERKLKDGKNNSDSEMDSGDKQLLEWKFS